MMRALTLHQPWADAVLIGAKRYETRGWSTPYRGLLAIHAAASEPTDAESRAAAREAGQLIIPARCKWMSEHRGMDLYQRGAIIVLATLADVSRVDGFRRLSDGNPRVLVRSASGMLLAVDYNADAMELKLGDWSQGRFLWHPDDVRPVWPPVKVRGQQGLWTVDPEVERLVLERLA